MLFRSNKTHKWNHHKPRKNKGISDGGEVELGARDDEAMKIGVRAISEVCEGEVCRWSVHHDYGIGIDVGIDVAVDGFWLPVQVDSWLWVGGASSFVGLGCRSSGFWLYFLGLSCCVFWV